MFYSTQYHGPGESATISTYTTTYFLILSLSILTVENKCVADTFRETHSDTKGTLSENKGSQFPTFRNEGRWIESLRVY